MKVKNIATFTVFSVTGIMATQLSSAQLLDEKQFSVRLGGSHAIEGDANLKELEDNLHGENDDLGNLKSDATWNISLAWRPLEHFGTELMYIGNTNNELVYDLTPTTKRHYLDFESQAANAYINWYPSEKNSALQPYLGIGVNYTNYDNVQLADTVQVGKLKGDELYATLSDTLDATAQIGFDYYFDSNLLINFAAIYTDSSPVAKVYKRENYTELFKDERFEPNPWTFNLGIGFTF